MTSTTTQFLCIDSSERLNQQESFPSARPKSKIGTAEAQSEDSGEYTDYICLMTHRGIMMKRVQFTLIVASLFHIWKSVDGCIPNLNGETMTFDCRSFTNVSEFDVYNFTLADLDRVTSILAPSTMATSNGPLRFIPPNICLFRNLRRIDLSTNSIVQPDPTEALTDCLTSLTEINLSSNQMSAFPSYMIYNMPNIQNVYFQRNQLTDVPLIAFRNIYQLGNMDFSVNRIRNLELWVLLANGYVNFQNNPISSITNTYSFNFPYNATTFGNLSLDTTESILNLNDGVFPMYNACDEGRAANEFLLNQSLTPPALLSQKIASISFGSTRLNCSCDQYYLLRSLEAIFGGLPWNPTVTPIIDVLCSDRSRFAEDTCRSSGALIGATLDFTTVNPRLCKIDPSEPGDLTVPAATVPPSSSLNATVRPRYATKHTSTGACFYTFSSMTTMSMRCLLGTTDDSIVLNAETFPQGYLNTVTRVNLANPMSSLPSYLCQLPSREIDLSSQNFIALTEETLPFRCLDFYQKVNLASNQIASVRTASGNFRNLAWLDLSSNRLTEIPYTLLRPTPSALRYLDLRNNSIRNIDLVLYTLQNITVLLDNNPINGSQITNVFNVTIEEIRNGTSSGSNISLPSIIAGAPFIINDQNMLLQQACTPLLVRSAVSVLSRNFNGSQLDCSCASINIKLIFALNGSNITNEYPCSIATNTQTFIALTRANCPNATDFTACTPTLTTTTTTTTNAVSTTGAILSNAQNSQSDRTGLIVGLTVGLGGLAILIVVVLVLIYCLKGKSAAAASKPVGRAAVIGQAPGKPLQSRASTRNPRSVKLAPLSSVPSKLPEAPVTTLAPTRTLADAKPLSTLGPTETRGPTRGIPLRLDPIRSPANINPSFSDNTTGFRPISNPLSRGPSLQPQSSNASVSKPPSGELLNIGGDSRYL